MADDRQTVPKFRGPPDNFKFWATRIRALLAEKDLDEVLEWEEDPDNEIDVRKVKKTCSIILRGLGDVPMAVIMNDTNSPNVQWESLHERYDSISDFQRAQVLTSITRKKYEEEPMDKYLAEWELADAHLKSMGAGLDEYTLVTLFFESFGGSQHRSYSGAITALQTKETAVGKKWQVACYKSTRPGKFQYLKRILIRHIQMSGLCTVNHLLETDAGMDEKRT